MESRPTFEQWLTTYRPMMGADGEAEGAATAEAATETPAATPTADYGPVNDRIDQLGAQMQEFMSQVTSRLPEPAQEQEPEFDWSEYDTADPTQAQQALDQFVQQKVQAALASVQGSQGQVQQELTQLRNSLEARELEQKYPQMQDPQYASALLDQAAEFAQHVAPPEVAQALAINSGFLELVHLAQMGSERAAGETPAGGQATTTLEDAAGGTPGGADTPSIVDQIRGSQGPRNSVFGFSTGARTQ